MAVPSDFRRTCPVTGISSRYPQAGLSRAFPACSAASCQNMADWPASSFLLWQAKDRASLRNARFFSAKVWQRAPPGFAVIMQFLQRPSSLALRRRSCPFRRLYSIYSGVLCLNRSYSRYSLRLVSNSAGVSSWWRFGFRAFVAAFLWDLLAKRFRGVFDVFFSWPGVHPRCLVPATGR